uniref:Uncharacterized protein n=1 Tax=Chromulina nebulosa TaxID=96789 RepID=A0A7S0SWE3_9STRA|mmetsp:Transcript_4751/g.4251  ORF Transcript_4751/g.4251 Transcript_4751/m.4251 type:complete len:250 (+) Transcript_4751:115-864(+)
MNQSQVTNKLKCHNDARKTNISNTNNYIKYIEDCRESISNICEILRMIDYNKTKNHELICLLKTRDVISHKLTFLNALEIQELAFWCCNFTTIFAKSKVITQKKYKLKYPKPSTCIMKLNVTVNLRVIEHFYAIEVINIVTAYRWIKKLNQSFANHLVTKVNKENILNRNCNKLKQGDKVFIEDVDEIWEGTFVTNVNSRNVLVIYEFQCDIALNKILKKAEREYYDSSFVFNNKNEEYLKAIGITKGM